MNHVASPLGGRRHSVVWLHDVVDMATEEEPADELLLAAARKDPLAFGEFYRRRVDALLAFFLRRTGDRELAADLTAETFAAALAAAPRYRAVQHGALPWLFAIAHGKLVDSFRHGQVEDRARRRLGLEPLVFTDEDLERGQRARPRRRARPARAALLRAGPVPPERTRPWSSAEQRLPRAAPQSSIPARTAL